MFSCLTLLRALQVTIIWVLQIVKLKDYLPVTLTTYSLGLLLVSALRDNAKPNPNTFGVLSFLLPTY